ncbi:MAG TPA: sulfurtransferase [Gemmatimonadales bacterium]|jgi:thiosulfate/3-mercaptopyruvate sulfurtransferase
MPQTTASVSDIATRGYARPEVLVSTQWVADHLTDPKVRLVESNEDVLLYDTGHIPGAVKIDWVADLNDPLLRDYIDRPRLERVLRAKGINTDTTVVFYGDKNNWWATYAFWVFKLFGVDNLRVMDGGRLRWVDENRPLETTVPTYAAGNITVQDRDDARIRAFHDQVSAHVQAGQALVDVRSPEEYRGERLHMPEYPNEGALRGGHIPGAKSIPWGRAVNPETHTFRPAAELRTIYEQENGLKSDQDIIAYCRIGERSSHTWFALTYLLGFTKVRNYDGSWTEWGNTVRAPIEKP